MTRKEIKNSTYLLLLLGSLIIGGCKNISENSNKNKSVRLIDLENKISKLEKKLSNIENQSSDSNLSKSSTTIKSLTFRIGTEDDRLRIYWSDGKKTDLPCTKDQNIWACG